MNSKFPRLLIVNGTPIGDKGGMGITLANMFSIWPTENILQLCYSSKDLDDSGTFKTIPLPTQTAAIDSVFRKLISRTSLSQWFNANRQGFNAGIAQSTIKGKLHDCVRALLDSTPIRIPRGIIEIVDQYRPEVIYSSLGTLRILKTVLYFAKRYDIKIAAHFMDDWPSTIYSASFLSRWANKKVERQIRHCLSRSNCSLGISELMTEEYERRYGVQFIWACNPVEIPEQRRPLPINQMITFTYSGGLHLDRWKGLEIIADTLVGFNQQGYATSLDIFTKEEDRLAFQPQMKQSSVIRWQGYIPAEQVPDALQASTVLVHVESFDTNIMDFTRYSFSTKLSEYMASGRPILAYAPAGIAPTCYLEKYGVGLVANTPKGLHEQLRRLIVDAELRRTIGDRGLEIAKLHHRKEVVQRRLLETIRSNVVA